MLKKLRIPIVVICLCLILSGCSFKLSPIDELISPISLSGENAEVQRAVEDYCNTDFSLKIPLKGKYTTSFIYYDINNDKKEEAVVFYESSDSVGTINMAVIEKKANGWHIIENISSGGSDIISVDFCDVNNDKLPEIIVCKSIISKSTNYSLSVYRQISKDNQLSLKTIGSSITACDFICADLNDDGTNEVVVLNLGTTATSPKAYLYSFKSNAKRLVGETKLDSSITAFSSIQVGTTDQGTSVFADALKNDGQSMVTELLYWSDYYNSIVSPFYSYDTGRTADTTRSNLLSSRDIDDDDSIEIPIAVKKKGLPSQVKAENWKSYKNTVLNHKCYSLSVQGDRYIIVLNDKIFSSVSVKYDEKQRELIIFSDKGKRECIRIKTVISSLYKASDYPDYEQVLSDSGFVYIAKISDKSNLQITVDNLKSMIKSY